MDSIGFCALLSDYLPIRGTSNMDLNEPLFDKVVGVLTPYIGETSARASVGLYLKQVGVDPQKLDTSDLEHLAQKLEPGMRVFVGGLKAKMLKRRILILGELHRPK